MVVAGLLAATASGGPLHELADDVKARLAQLQAAAVPARPQPVTVTWKPQRMTPSVELGAPLVAMTAADLDGDGRAELYAVTTTEVIAFSVTDHHVKELGRVAFGGDKVVPASRDPFGAATVDGAVVVASSSLYQRGLKVHWDRKKLAGDIGEPGVLVCPGEKVSSVVGRDYYGDEKTGYYGVRCRDAIRAVLRLSGRLEIGTYAIAHAGHAFDVGDLDRDGKPEVVFASANAPGEPDDVRAVTIGEDEKKTRWKKGFTAGGVAAVAIGDFDGAPAVIAAVRLVGATRIDLWRLN